MGMDLYNSSPVARAVWDSADAHSISAYSFSIVEIVRENPRKRLSTSAVFKGQAIRERYMEMTYDTTDKNGSIKSLPLFADINIPSLQHTFTHPKGLLFATQFAQVALVITSRAAFEDMRSKGLVQPGAAFASHSLGEFSALAAVADILPNSPLVDIVFYRGLTIQHAVEHDEEGRSNYAKTRPFVRSSTPS